MHITTLYRNTALVSGNKLMSDSGHVLCSDESMFQMLLGGKQVSFYVIEIDKIIQVIISEMDKSSICDGIRVHKCPWHDWFVYLWTYHWCREYWNIGETQTTFSVTSLLAVISAGKCQTRPVAVISGLSGGIALKTNMILLWISLHGFRIITVSHATKKAYRWATKTFIWDEKRTEVERPSMNQWITIWNSFLEITYVVHTLFYVSQSSRTFTNRFTSVLKSLNI